MTGSTAAQDRPYGLWFKSCTSIEWILEPVGYDRLHGILGDFEGSIPPVPQLRATIAYLGAESLFEAMPNLGATMTLGMPLHGDVLLMATENDKPLPADAVEWLSGIVAGPPDSGPRTEQLELWSSDPEDGSTAA